jgi:hypothetical protein
MATSTVQFFSTIEELVTILQNVVADLHLSVFLYRGGDKRAIKYSTNITVQEIKDFGASRLYLAEPSVGINHIDSNDISTGKLGLIQVTLPCLSDQILFMADIGVKTDWFDSVTKERLINDRLMPLFKKVKRYIVKNMMSPVLVINIVTGSNAKYSDIKYTKAAKFFNENGGELMQEGVNNLRFKCL